MKKSSTKQDLVAESKSVPLAAKKAKEASESFRKFMPNRERNKNNSSVGPSWGGRKGN